MAEKTNKGYLTGKEIRAITKANAKEMKRLEAYKNRKAKEEEFLTEMRDDSNILEIEDLHTYFFTEQGVVKAVNGVSYDVPKHSVVGVVGESGCGKSVTSMSVMRLIQGPTGQIVEGSIRFKAYDYKRDEKGNPVAAAEGGYEMEEKVYDASSGGGAVTAVASGKKELVSIKINPEVVDPDDVEMLEDLIVAATNEALRKMEEEENSDKHDDDDDSPKA